MNPIHDYLGAAARRVFEGDKKAFDRLHTRKAKIKSYEDRAAARARGQYVDTGRHQHLPDGSCCGREGMFKARLGAGRVGGNGRNGGNLGGGRNFNVGMGAGGGQMGIGMGLPGRQRDPVHAAQMGMGMPAREPAAQKMGMGIRWQNAGHLYGRPRDSGNKVHPSANDSDSDEDAHKSSSHSNSNTTGEKKGSSNSHSHTSYHTTQQSSAHSNSAREPSSSTHRDSSHHSLSKGSGNRHADTVGPGSHTHSSSSSKTAKAADGEGGSRRVRLQIPPTQRPTPYPHHPTSSRTSHENGSTSSAKTKTGSSHSQAQSHIPQAPKTKVEDRGGLGNNQRTNIEGMTDKTRAPPSHHTRHQPSSSSSSKQSHIPQEVKSKTEGRGIGDNQRTYVEGLVTKMGGLSVKGSEGGGRSHVPVKGSGSASNNRGIGDNQRTFVEGMVTKPGR